MITCFRNKDLFKDQNKIENGKADDKAIESEEAKDKTENKKEKNVKKEISQMLLNREIETKVSFEYNPKQMTQSKKLNLLRYQVNPTKNWGPGSLPKANVSATEKKIANQNKNKLKRKSDCLDNSNEEINA